MTRPAAGRKVIVSHNELTTAANGLGVSVPIIVQAVPRHIPLRAGLDHAIDRCVMIYWAKTGLLCCVTSCSTPSSEPMMYGYAITKTTSSFFRSDFARKRPPIRSELGPCHSHEHTSVCQDDAGAAKATPTCRWNGTLIPNWFIARRLYE